MKKLVIEIPLEGNDLEDKQVEIFLQEVKRANTFSGGLHLEVGSPLEDAEDEKKWEYGLCRTVGISAEYFDVKLVDGSELL